MRIYVLKVWVIDIGGHMKQVEPIHESLWTLSVLLSVQHIFFYKGCPSYSSVFAAVVDFHFMNPAHRFCRCDPFSFDTCFGHREISIGFHCFSRMGSDSQCQGNDSPKKVNLVAALVRGMRVEDALLQLQVTVKRASKTVYQTLNLPETSWEEKEVVLRKEKEEEEEEETSQALVHTSTTSPFGEMNPGVGKRYKCKDSYEEGSSGSRDPGCVRVGLSTGSIKLLGQYMLIVLDQKQARCSHQLQKFSSPVACGFEDNDYIFQNKKKRKELVIMDGAMTNSAQNIYMCAVVSATWLE
ncbi:hypothetical protein FRX31_028781 [Thalictrum thalictroides]|uniref:50S ribosomal protein L22, chloroplastic n=1 Tax=Thalictrum thalictroides TaxID=46969 RepID=A0A7J6V991_THATH|nr:hypothetical protein FRX31_028781 [Thalictrum thalictroides]